MRRWWLLGGLLLLVMGYNLWVTRGAHDFRKTPQYRQWKTACEGRGGYVFDLGSDDACVEQPKPKWQMAYGEKSRAFGLLL